MGGGQLIAPPAYNRFDVMLIVLMARHPSVHPPHAYTKNDMKQIREQNSLNVNLTLGNLYTIQQKNAMSMHTAAKCTTSMFRYAQTKTQTKKKQTKKTNQKTNKQDHQVPLPLHVLFKERECL
jgi:hypothetical protein